MTITYETLQADADGEMLIMRQVARIWLATCQDEDVNYQDRQTLAAFEAVGTSELLNLVEALAENIRETA